MKSRLKPPREIYLAMGCDKSNAVTSAQNIIDMEISMAEKAGLRGVKNIGDVQIEDDHFTSVRVDAGLIEVRVKEN